MQCPVEALVPLLQHCEQFASHMLRTTGSFAPFGALIDRAGNRELLGSPIPSSAEAYEGLRALLAHRLSLKDLGAYALAAVANAPSGLNSPFPTGIRIELEAPGYSRWLFTPYRVLPLAALRRFLVAIPSVEFAPEIAIDAPPVLFTDVAGA